MFGNMFKTRAQLEAWYGAPQELGCTPVVRPGSPAEKHWRNLAEAYNAVFLPESPYMFWLGAAA